MASADDENTRLVDGYIPIEMTDAPTTTIPRRRGVLFVNLYGDSSFSQAQLDRIDLRIRHMLAVCDVDVEPVVILSPQPLNIEMSLISVDDKRQIGLTRFTG